VTALSDLVAACAPAGMQGSAYHSRSVSRTRASASARLTPAATARSQIAAHPAPIPCVVLDTTFLRNDGDAKSP
jgi:hypothetical protein